MHVIKQQMGRLTLLGAFGFNKTSLSKSLIPAEVTFPRDWGRAGGGVRRETKPRVLVSVEATGKYQEQFLGPHGRLRTVFPSTQIVYLRMPTRL